MVRSFLTTVGREIRGMHEAAYILAVFALGSQLLALVRDRLLASTFGASHTLDLYYAAFRIPDFLFATIASLLSLYALLPVLSRLEREHPGAVVSFLRQVLLVFFVSMGAISLGAVFAAPWLVAWVAPGIASPELVLLVRILLLQPVLLGASNILAAFTQMRQRFLLYSISPLLYNVGIIIGIILLYPRLGVAGLGWGVVVGALLHLLVQVPFFGGEKEPRRLPWKVALKDIGSVLLLSIPRTFALGAGQISLLVLVAIASVLSAGSISIFMFAYNLQAVPLTIIGVSYSVAAFPTLARLHAAGAHQEFVRYIETALRHILFWAIPATIFVIVLRAQLVRVILGAGAFGWEETRLTAAALALFITALVAQSLILLIARAYYAAGNTKKPFYWGLIDVVVSVLAGLAFVILFRENQFVRDFVESLLRVSHIPGTEVLMLAFGYALGSIVECLIAFAFFMRDFKISRIRIGSFIFQSFAASVLGGAAAYGVLYATGMAGTVNTAVGLVLQGTAAALVGLLVAAGILMLFKSKELSEVLSALHDRFKSTRPVALEATDVSS